MPHVIAWDLETIPDISGFAAANDLFGKLPEEVRGESYEASEANLHGNLSALPSLVCDAPQISHALSLKL